MTQRLIYSKLNNQKLHELTVQSNAYTGGRGSLTAGNSNNNALNNVILGNGGVTSAGLGGIGISGTTGSNLIMQTSYSKQHQ